MRLFDEVKDDAGNPGGGNQPADGNKPADGKPADGKPADDGNKPVDGSKPAEGAKPAAGAKPGEKPAEKQGAPEKYEFKAPEGVTLDEGLVTEFSGTAKELGLSQAQADKVFGIGVKLMEKQSAAIVDYYKKAREGWVNEVKTDKEIGGANLDQNLATAKKAIAAFDTDGQLVKFLNESGAGDNPALIRAFVKIGKAISDDKLVTGRGAPAKQEGGLTFSYPNSKHAA